MVILQLHNKKNIIMSVSEFKTTQPKTRKANAKRSQKGRRVSLEHSPSWVVEHANSTTDYKLLLIDRIRVGVKKSEWKELLRGIGHTEKELEFMLPTSISSMQKRDVYSKETSERIYELAELYALGYSVFDTKEDFKKWLMTPSPALGERTPFELLDSSFGFDLVEQEILRIQYNVYS